jgi:hypothetical protein
MSLYLTGGAGLVEWSPTLPGSVARNKVPESDGGEGNEAVVERVYVIPVGFQARKDGGGNQEECYDYERHDL